MKNCRLGRDCRDHTQIAFPSKLVALHGMVQWEASHHPHQVARQLLELNLIETAWACIKGELKDSRTNMEEFEEDLKLWILRMEDSQYHRDLVVSMPKRLQEVVQRNRGSTHFNWKLLYINKIWTFYHYFNLFCPAWRTLFPGPVRFYFADCINIYNRQRLTNDWMNIYRWFGNWPRCSLLGQL